MEWSCELGRTAANGALRFRISFGVGLGLGLDFDFDHELVGIRMLAL